MDDGAREMLRTRFNLPDGAVIDAFERSKQTKEIAEDTVQFSAAQLKAFVAAAPGLAAARTQSYGVNTSQLAGRSAEEWHPAPPPLKPPPARFNDVPRLYDYWGELGGSNVRHGSIFCAVYVKKGGPGPENSARYEETNCANVTRGMPVYAITLGVIDFDKRTLRMRIKRLPPALR